jgi:DNA-binding protein HU-beta
MTEEVHGRHEADPRSGSESIAYIFWLIQIFHFTHSSAISHYLLEKRLALPASHRVFLPSDTHSARKHPPSMCAQARNQQEVKQRLKKIVLLPVDFVLPKCDCVRKNTFAMNKAELIESIQKALGADTTKRAAEQSLDAVLDSIAKGVKKDKKVQIIGFGTFEVKKRAARLGRNPKTGEALKIAASKSVGFKASSVLKGSL